MIFLSNLTFFRIMVGLLEGCFYEYFLITGCVGDDFIWFLESHRTFYLSDRCLFTPFLHGEISLLSLHPWIPLIDINKSDPSFRMIWTFLKNLNIILIDFCKQSTLEPTISARKWKLEFSFAGFFVVRCYFHTFCRALIAIQKSLVLVVPFWVYAL